MVMELGQVLGQAKKQLGEITGLKAVGVTRVFKDGQGWHVGVELLEMSRLPSSSDLLGSYDVTLSEDGELVQMERKGIRLRGEPRDEENGS